MKKEIDLDAIVREARETIEAFHDEKVWAGREEMDAIIEAGAQIIQNRRQISGGHVTEVIFNGIHFIHSSSYPLIPNISSQVH